MGAVQRRLGSVKEGIVGSSGYYVALSLWVIELPVFPMVLQPGFFVTQRAAFCNGL